MAFGTQKRESSPVVFLDLRSKAAEPNGVGFRQTLSKQPNPEFGTTPNAPKNLYQYAMHEFVSGRIIGFQVKEEASYDDPNQKVNYGLVRIADNVPAGVEAGPDAIVKFSLTSGFGRKMVGLICAAAMEDVKQIHLQTNRADAGTKIGDMVLEKAQAYLNMKVDDAHGRKLTPVYMTAGAEPLLDEKGAPARLPQAEEVVVNRKKQLDFSAADEVVEQTAKVLVVMYAVDQHAEADESHAAEAGADDGGIDLAEAAAAAAPAA